MNVLVYSGSEVVQTSLDHTLSSLRSLLLPHYSVQPISPQSLLSQPWQPNCALLVFPGCRDIVLTKSASKINEFVNKGGAFLGLGTGAHYSLKGLSPALSGAASSSATADMMLRFSDIASGSHIYPSFQPSGSDTSARAVAIQTSEGERIDLMYQGGSGELLGAEGEKKPKVRVLARFLESDVPGAVAAASYGVGAGKVALWAASPEFPLTEEPASSVALALSPSPATLDLAEERRQLVMRRSLVLLGLNLPEPGETVNRPIAQYLVSHFLKPAIVSVVTRALGGVDLFEDESDHFQLHSFETVQNARAIAVAQSNPSTWQPKHIIVCDGQLPGPEQTPLFDLTLFFSSLSAARKKEELQEDREPWCFGDALLYGEVVTSTQTMLDKNPRLMHSLPAPILSLASHQLAGRGRGANVWLSPSGCLQFSLLLRLSMSGFPAHKIVFVQYLFALAVVEACRDESVLGEAGASVRLKWPNDIYLDLDGVRRKIGGILVNTSFNGGNADLVIGCGLNVLNPPPISSLSEICPDGSLSMERTAAAILVRFERMWHTYVAGKGSFEPFMDLYLRRWMHSDQLVTLTTTEPHQLVRIVGITPDHGLLRTLPERSGWSTNPAFVDLQPDGNSFDLMAGMIKSKK